MRISSGRLLAAFTLFSFAIGAVGVFSANAEANQRLHCVTETLNASISVSLGASGDRALGAPFPLEGRLAKIGAHFDHGEVTHRFLESGKMVYNSKGIALEPEGREFHVSNEFDWFKTPIDYQKTSTVVGFGSNSAWDLAMRKGADHLIIGDWHIGPLLTQEYLFRPLILQARTPQEFLSLLTAVPLPENLNSQDIGETFTYIDQYLRKNSSFTPDRINLVGETLKKMGSNFKISDDQLRGVASFYLDMIHATAAPSNTHFGPVKGHFIKMLWPQILTGRGPFFDLLKRRYDPNSLVRDGADPKKVNSPFFSVFSSRQAFQELQHLFDGNIQYAHTGYDDPAFYVALRKNLGAASPYGFTLSITNIIDCIDSTVCGQNDLLTKIISTARDQLATPATPLTVFRSSKTFPPHDFHRYEIKPDSPLDQVIH